MPRNGANVYSPPAGTIATTLTPVASPPYNAFVNDLAADANLARPIVAGGTGATSVAGAQTSLTVVGYSVQTLTAAQQVQARANISAALNGQLFGLTLSNNATDAVNDIDIAVGEAASSESNPVLMVLASVLTKRLDAAWAVGTGNGGLDTGSIANGTYHIWLIQRSDTGVVDALFSASATSPTMPTNYDRKRRIGSILRGSGTIFTFTQNGDEFLLGSQIQDVTVSNLGGTSTFFTLSVPQGVKVMALIHGYFSNVAANKALYLHSPDQSDLPAAGSNITVQNNATSAAWWYQPTRVDTSARIKAVADTASSFLGVFTRGWIDTRGRS